MGADLDVTQLAKTHRGSQPPDVCGESVPGRGNSGCRSPEAGVCPGIGETGKGQCGWSVVSNGMDGEDHIPSWKPR